MKKEEIARLNRQADSLNEAGIEAYHIAGRWFIRDRPELARLFYSLSDFCFAEVAKCEKKIEQLQY